MAALSLTHSFAIWLIASFACVSVNGYQCTCAVGFKGKNCEISESFCFASSRACIPLNLLVVYVYVQTLTTARRIPARTVRFPRTAPLPADAACTPACVGVSD